MNEIFLDCYIKISILIAVVDVILAMKSIRKKKYDRKVSGLWLRGSGFGGYQLSDQYSE